LVFISVSVNYYFSQLLPALINVIYVLLFYSQFIDVSVLDGGWSERPEQMARAKRYRWHFVTELHIFNNTL